MKYFTRDLLNRIGSISHDEHEAASEEWDKAQEDYLAYLTRNRAELPPGVESFLEHDFHDASVLFFTIEGSNFCIYVRVESEKNRGMKLSYDLQDQPVISRLPVPVETTPLQWWYDELELLPSGGVHSILLSNGIECRIPFRSMQAESCELATNLDARNLVAAS